MTMVYDAIPSPVYRAFQQITHQNRIDVALSVAVKDLIRLRLKEVNAERVAYEAKYGMTFEQFNAKFQAEEIADQYSYAIESDYFDWEAAVTNQAYLEELGDTLL